MIVFRGFLPIRPKAWQAPYFTKSRSFVSSDFKRWQSDIKLLLKSEITRCNWKGLPIKEACYMITCFYMPVPKSIKKSDYYYLQFINTPDVSNLKKGLEDACKEVLFEDDKYIIGSIETKQYAWDQEVGILIILGTGLFTECINEFNHLMTIK